MLTDHAHPLFFKNIICEHTSGLTNAYPETKAVICWSKTM